MQKKNFAIIRGSSHLSAHITFGQSQTGATAPLSKLFPSTSGPGQNTVVLGNLSNRSREIIS
jgi:hypothetical protein